MPRSSRSAPDPGDSALSSSPEPPIAPAPEPEPTPELGVAATPAPEPESEQVSFRDALQGKGYDVGQFADDDALLEHITGEIQRARQIPELARKAQYFDYLAPYAADIDALIQQKMAPAPQKAIEETPYWEKPPQWDPLWDRGLEYDEQLQQYRARPGFHPDLPQKYAARKEWERRAAARLLDDPAAVVREGLKADFESLRAEARSIAQEELTRYRQEQQANAFVLEHARWLYEPDAGGRPKIDPSTGQPIFSQNGVRFVQLTQQLAAVGTRPEYIPSLALQLMAAPGQQSPSLAATASGPSAGSPGDALREQFIAGGQFAPGRGGGQIASAAQPGAPAVGPDEDIRTMLARAMQQAGITSTEVP